MEALAETVRGGFMRGRKSKGSGVLKVDAGMSEQDADKYISTEMEVVAVQKALQKLLEQPGVLAKLNKLIDDFNPKTNDVLAYQGVGKALFKDFEALYKKQLTILQQSREQLLAKLKK